MKVHVLVEGPSEAAFVEAWAPRLLRGHELKAYPHQGKGRLPGPGETVAPSRRGLLDQLPSKLRAFGKEFDSDTDRVLVLVDADNESCVDLKKRMLELLAQIERPPKVLFRIAIEELEAFYLGDLAALRNAYPNHDAKKARSYVPDSICSTAELFGEVIDDGGLNKVAWAETMGPKLTVQPKRSRSPSFKKLVAGLRELVSVAPQAKQKAKRRHAAKPKKGKRPGK